MALDKVRERGSSRISSGAVKKIALSREEAFAKNVRWRRVVMLLAHRKLPRWRRLLIDVSCADLYLEDGETSPEYRINWAGVVVWVFLLCLAAFLIIM